MHCANTRNTRYMVDIQASYSASRPQDGQHRQRAVPRVVAATGRLEAARCRNHAPGRGHLAAKQARAASGCRRLSTQRDLPECLRRELYVKGKVSAIISAAQVGRVLVRGLRQPRRGEDQAVEQRTPFVGEELLLDPHEARPSAPVRAGAWSHVPAWLASAFLASARPPDRSPA